MVTTSFGDPHATACTFLQEHISLCLYRLEIKGTVHLTMRIQSLSSHPHADLKLGEVS